MILILTCLWSLVYFSDCLEKSEPKMPIDILFFNLSFISPYSRGRGYRKQSRGALSNAVTHFQICFQRSKSIISTGGFKRGAGGHGSQKGPKSYETNRKEDLFILIRRKEQEGKVSSRLN